MRYIRILAFILLALSLLSLAFLFFISTIRMWQDRYWTRLTKGKLFIYSIFTLSFSLFFLIVAVPSIRDLPTLIKGDYRTIEGTVHKEIISKSFLEKVSVDEVYTYFFIDSGVEEGQRCIISYLPHSKSGINIVNIDGTPIKVGAFSICFIGFYILLLIGVTWICFFKSDFLS